MTRRRPPRRKLLKRRIRPRAAPRARTATLPDRKKSKKKKKVPHLSKRWWKNDLDRTYPPEARERFFNPNNIIVAPPEERMRNFLLDAEYYESNEFYEHLVSTRVAIYALTRILTDDDLKIAASIAEIARAYHLRKLYPQTAHHAQRAKNRFEYVKQEGVGKAYQKIYVDVLIMLADAYVHQKKTSIAVQNLLKKALRINTDVMGDNSEGCAILEKLVRIQMKRLKYDEAIESLERLLALRTRLFGENDDGLEKVYIELGRASSLLSPGSAKSVDYLENALKLGTKNTNGALLTITLANAASLAGRILVQRIKDPNCATDIRTETRAIEFLNRAKKALPRLHGNNSHQSIVKVIEELISLRLFRGDEFEASTLCEELVTVIREAYGKRHEKLADAYCAQAEVFVRMDQIPDARYAYALALGILELKLSKKHEKYRAIKTKVYDLDSFRPRSRQQRSPINVRHKGRLSSSESKALRSLNSKLDAL